MTKRLIWNGSYEPGTTRVIDRLLAPGMTFIDIGAHIGYYTLLACKAVGPQGTVYAFEPEPDNFRLLEHNVDLNGFGNAHLTCTAIADVEGPVDLWLSDRSTGHSIAAPASVQQSKARVNATSLDSFLASRYWPIVHLVKIDVEGAEIAVLKGMVGTLRRNSGIVLVVEFSPGNLVQAGVNADDLVAMLQGEGFVLQRILEPSGTLRPFRAEDLTGITAKEMYPYLNVLAIRDASREVREE